MSLQNTQATTGGIKKEKTSNLATQLNSQFSEPEVCLLLMFARVNWHYAQQTEASYNANSCHAIIRDLVGWKKHTKKGRQVSYII
jgi:hypothetical protein